MRLSDLCTQCSLRELLPSMESLQNAVQRTVYLITYSRADMAKCPCKERFSSPVVEAWNSCGITVVQLVVCIEAHTNTCESTDEMNLYHYHMALKLGKKARWLQVRNYLDQNFGIQVNLTITTAATTLLIAMLPKTTRTPFTLVVIQIFRMVLRELNGQ